MTIIDRIRLARYLTHVCRMAHAWHHTGDLFRFADGRSHALNWIEAQRTSIPAANDDFDDAATDPHHQTIVGYHAPRLPHVHP